MRILYLAHRIPYPPNKGDKIRAYHQLVRLAQCHEVDLFTLVDDPDDRRHIADLERICASVTAVDLPPASARLRALGALIAGRPFSPAFFNEPALRIALREHVERRAPEAIVFFCSGVGGLLPGPEATGDLPIVADYCDLDSAKWGALAATGGLTRRLLFGPEAGRLARYEVQLARRCRHVVFATHQESGDFLALPGSSCTDVRVVANGVDHDYFDRRGLPAEARPTVIFTGAMDYRPNSDAALWFIDRCWADVRARVPGARLLVVGRQPPRSLMRHSGHSGVDVTGTVPDIRPYLHAGWVAVAPLQVARGVQNKVLEAMAAEVPTVISPAVARGLEARDGHDVLVADTPDEWADQVTALLQNASVRAWYAKNGLAYVREHHHWDHHGDLFGDLLQRLTPHRLRGAA